MELLARVLKNNTSLTHLDLSNNRLECPGAKFLAEALAHANTNLTWYVCNNTTSRITIIEAILYASKIIR